MDSISEKLLHLREINDETVKNLAGPYFISWDVTNRCNFKCLHCLNRSGDSDYYKSFSDELTEDEAMDLCNQIIEINPFSVCICGGEPLLRKDIFKILKKLSSNIFQVNMVSNGYLIDEEKADMISQSGITMLQISLDSDGENFHDAFRSHEGAFSHALNAIKLMKNKHIQQFAVAFCPTTLNIDQFNHFVDIMVENGVKSIRMMPLLPLGRGYDNYVKLKPSDDQYLDLVYKIKKKEEQYKSEALNIEWGDPLEHIALPVFENREIALSLEVRSNGDIGPSIYMPISVGNIRKHTLKEYWDNGFNFIWRRPEVLEMAKKYLTVSDFKDVKLKAWTDERKYIDIIEEQKED